MLHFVSGAALLEGILGAFQTHIFQRLFSGLSVCFPHAHTASSLPPSVFFLNSVCVKSWWRKTSEQTKNAAARLGCMLLKMTFSVWVYQLICGITELHRQDLFPGNPSRWHLCEFHCTSFVRETWQAGEGNATAMVCSVLVICLTQPEKGRGKTTDYFNFLLVCCLWFFKIFYFKVMYAYTHSGKWVWNVIF